MKIFIVLLLLIFPIASYSDSILPIKSASEWVSTVEFEAPESIDGNAIFLESFDMTKIENISMSESYNYMNEQEQWVIRTNKEVKGGIKYRYFIVSEKKAFPAYARELIIDTRLQRANIKDDGKFDLKPINSKVLLKAEITLRGEELYRVMGGFAYKGPNRDGPKLLSFIDVDEDIPSSKLVIKEVPGKTYKQIYLLNGSASTPLAYVSKTEKPKLGVYWGIINNKQLFALTIVDHAPNPEGMGAKCQSRTVVYEVLDNKYIEQSDSGFHCYVH